MGISWGLSPSREAARATQQTGVPPTWAATQNRIPISSENSVQWVGTSRNLEGCLCAGVGGTDRDCVGSVVPLPFQVLRVRVTAWSATQW